MLGIDGGKKHVAEALAKYDTDGTKSLDLGEFTMLVKGLHDVDLVEAVFKQADKDNSGTIEAKELKRVLGHFGLMPTEPHVKAAIEGYDTLTKMKDGRIGRKDKKLDLPEFQRLVKDLLDGAARRKEALTEVMVRVEGEFVKADKNKSGTIDWKELKKVLASLGHDMGKTYCQKVVKKFDDDGSKTLDLDEFKSVVGHLMGAQEKYDDAKVEAEFTRADKNASGTIDAAELRGVLGKLGHDLGKKYVANVLKKYDDDGSKALSLKEFKAVIASIRRRRRRRGRGGRRVAPRRGAGDGGAPGHHRRPPDAVRRVDRRGDRGGGRRRRRRGGGGGGGRARRASPRRCRRRGARPTTACGRRWRRCAKSSSRRSS